MMHPAGLQQGLVGCAGQLWPGAAAGGWVEQEEQEHWLTAAVDQQEQSTPVLAPRALLPPAGRGQAVHHHHAAAAGRHIQGRGQRREEANTWLIFIAIVWRACFNLMVE